VEGAKKFSWKTPPTLTSFVEAKNKKRSRKTNKTRKQPPNPPAQHIQAEK